VGRKLRVEGGFSHISHKETCEIWGTPSVTAESLRMSKGAMA
jgi:hypothetical protein